MSHEPVSVRNVVLATTVLAYLGLLMFVMQICAFHWRKLCKIRGMWTANYAASWVSVWRKNDPLEQQVHKLMAKSHLHRISVGLAGWSYITVVYLVLTLAQMHVDPRTLATDHWAWVTVTEWDFLPGTFCLWVVRLAMQFPVLIRAWTVNLFFAVLMARMAVRDFLVPSLLQSGQYYIHFIASQRLLIFFLQGYSWTAIASNIAYTVCSLCIFYYNFGWDQYHFIYESMALVVVLVLGRIFHKWTYAEARATIEAKALARSQATVQRLLSAMCDAVVQFGSDGIIRHPCPKLEVLLLKSRTRSSLQGTPFNDFFDGSERERLANFLSSMTNEPYGSELPNQVEVDLTKQDDVACMLHSHMRDATGTSVPVQIFHGSLRDINEEICHVVGIREDQETVSSMRPTDLPASVDSGLPPLIEHCIMPATESVSDLSSISASSSLPAAEVAVWLDTTTPAFSVVRYTAGFSALSGALADGTDLQSWISGKKQWKRFRSWVQEAFNTFYHGSEAPSGKNPTENTIEVTLSPPHLKRFKLVVKATVAVADIEVTGEDDHDDASQHIIMQLVFSNISWSQGHASPNMRRRHSRPQETQREIFM